MTHSHLGALLTTSEQPLHASLDDVEQVKFQIIKKVAYFALATHVLLILFFAQIGALTLAIVNIFSVLAWGSGIFLISQRLHALALRIFCIEVVLHSILACATLGLELGFQFYLWTISSMLLVDYQLKLKQAVIYSMTLIITFAGLYFFFADVTYNYAYVSLLPYINIINIIIAGLPMIYAFSLIREISISQRIELTEMAAKDHLTKLYNRRFAKQLIIETRQKSIMADNQICVVMADIDMFKQINDTYGHDKGDAILTIIASALTNQLNSTDIIVRWGGEEFLIVLANTNEADAFVRIEALRNHIQALSLLSIKPNLTITMSFGLIEWRPLASLEKTLQQADAALYKSKNDGRNMTTIATPEQDYMIGV
ncbi:DNA polymerase III subunit delta' [Pseudoalteromonas porphyrae]|nr:DNA polymerase III subunit delta' [Pseudoalteromonas porphyrae]